MLQCSVSLQCSCAPPNTCLTSASSTLPCSQSLHFHRIPWLGQFVPSLFVVITPVLLSVLFFHLCVPSLCSLWFPDLSFRGVFCTTFIFSLAHLSVARFLFPAILLFALSDFWDFVPQLIKATSFFFMTCSPVCLAIGSFLRNCDRLFMKPNPHTQTTCNIQFRPICQHNLATRRHVGPARSCSRCCRNVRELCQTAIVCQKLIVSASLYTSTVAFICIKQP